MAARSKTTKTTKTTRTSRTTRSAKSAVAATPVRKTTPRVKKASQQKTSLLDFFRIGESYTSLVLGIVVVIVISILLLSLFRTRNTDSQQGATSTNTVATENADNSSDQKTYTVKPGDDLWQIAVDQYGDGYKWTLIAKANNLANPGVINVGNKLVIPAVEAEKEAISIVTPSPTATATATPTQAPETTISQPSTGGITGNTYTIKSGDYLWDIAVRAYGDGYRWVDIARANKLVNPDIIHVGNQLQIPR